jgi:hypothetical protein
MPTPKIVVCPLLCALATSGCAFLAPSPPPTVLEVPPPRLAPPPADVMVPRPANFRERLLLIFGASQPMPTQ